MTFTKRHEDPNQHANLSDKHHVSHHGDFDPEQAALLQDLARNGAPEAQMYGYSEVGESGAHLNGLSDGTVGDMHSNGLMQSQHELDIDDPAALLESLANFDHPSSSNNNNAPISNDHFASLLQAAATAGGEEAARVDLGRTRSSTAHSSPRQGRVTRQNDTPGLRSRRRLHEKPETQESYGLQTRNTRRKRALDESDEEEQLRREREREIWGPEEPEKEDLFDGEPHYANSPISTSEARAVGVHSAAALFRRPSSASKKYTRPPMSKLFTSLELTPEQFLHLQAAAKVYMLDPKFPERRDCVGNRGRTDTDMVKLKLFGCVKSFLEDEEWGEKCFGVNAEGAETRKLRWPQMKNKVISLVTPLLRRMVTNERQRQYAVETRKSTGIPSSNVKASSTKTREAPDTSPTTIESNSQYPDIDPKLDQYHYNIDPSFHPNTSADDPSLPHPNEAPNELEPSTSQAPFPESSPPPDSSLAYHINILHNDMRVRPKLMLSPSSCPGFSSLVQHVRGVLSDADDDDQNGAEPVSVHVLCPDGLRDVGDEEETWQDAIKSVEECVWMDGQVRVLVEVRYSD